MPIKLNGQTSGSVQLDVPAAVTGGDVNLSLPGAGTVDRLERAGNILQVVQTTKTDAYSSTATSATAVTGMAVTITPSSASSKVLLLFMLSADSSSSGYFYIDDSTNPLLIGDTGQSNQNEANFQINRTGIEASGGICNFTFLHSPSTTSAITYRLMHLNPNSGTIAINRTAFDGNNTFYGRFASTMIAQEVAA